jgi:mannose-6-phosphate isomerase
LAILGWLDFDFFGDVHLSDDRRLVLAASPPTGAANFANKGWKITKFPGTFIHGEREERAVMNQISLYPLRFEPIYQYRLWGGRRLASLLSSPLPDDEPIGEAWILSDRDDHASVVADGPLKGRTLGHLLEQAPEHFLGKLAEHYTRFPLLLKFLDVSKRLSVQVHPSDAHKELIPAGDTGKTEAWVVLEKGPEARIYAGLNPGTTADVLRQTIANGTVADQLASFVPNLGDGVFIRAGTVHSLSDVVVFEVQENSDVTFRLYDWDNIDSKTGQRRPLQVEQAMACINLKQGVIGPVTPHIHETRPLPWEKLIHCDHFSVWRISDEFPFVVGATATCRVVVCIEGRAELEHAGTNYPMATGDVMLLPAVVGACRCRPNGTVTLLEISLPEISRGA